MTVAECALDTGRGIGRACPAHGYIHGRLEPRPVCDGCGAADFVVLVGTDFGARYCRSCRRTGGPQWQAAEPAANGYPLVNGKEQAKKNVLAAAATDGDPAKKGVSPEKRGEIQGDRR